MRPVVRAIQDSTLSVMSMGGGLARHAADVRTALRISRCRPDDIGYTTRSGPACSSAPAPAEAMISSDAAHDAVRPSEGTLWKDVGMALLWGVVMRVVGWG
jgi:hypothetical protein